MYILLCFLVSIFCFDEGLSELLVTITVGDKYSRDVWSSIHRGAWRNTLLGCVGAAVNIPCDTRILCILLFFFFFFFFSSYVQNIYD